MSEEFEKESRDPMIQKISTLMQKNLENLGVNFCIQGEPLQSDEISAHNGLLSLFCYKAAVWSSTAMSKTLPLFFEHDKSALIEVVPMTESKDNNIFSLWSHFLHFSLEEEVRRLKNEKKMQNGMYPLDELYTEWHQAIKANKFAVRPNAKTAPRGAGG